MEKRQSLHGMWSSRLAFILAITGSAVGLGNVWKFPYITGENGGGAFLLVYLVCILLVGVPVMMAEMIIGRRGRRNPANAFKDLAKECQRSSHWQWVGLLTIVTGGLILTFYAVIAGWALIFMYHAIAGHFNQATGAETSLLFTTMLANPWQLLIGHAGITILTVSIVARGVQQGLERAIMILMPGLFVLLMVLLAYALGTGHFSQSLHFLFYPDFSKITLHGEIIALGHAFFTLSLASGITIAYGAYMPSKYAIARTAIIVTIADTFVALLSGIVIFPIVFANGLTPSSGPGLLFQSLPIAFGNMPYGQLFGTLFFLMLVFAALSSSIALLEAPVAWTIENTGITRKRAAVLVGLLIWAVGLASLFSFNVLSHVKLFNMRIFDAMDHTASNLMLPLGGLLIAVFVGWRMRNSDLQQELRMRNAMLYRCWLYTLRYVAPVGILLVFLDFIGVINL